MTPEAVLTKLAIEMVSDLKRRALSLQQEKFRIESRLRQIEAQNDTARLASQRLLNYEPAIGSQLACPSCWIQDEVRAALVPLPGTDTEDRFECHRCKLEYEVPQ